MIRRWVPRLLLVAVLAGGAWLLFLRGGGDTPPRYTIAFDNAYGITSGAEIRVADVKVGSVSDTAVDDDTAHALVDVEITNEEFGHLRADATCTIEPQSLIGEYYVECEPGRASRPLREGATIPVERTTTTIPPDLVLNIMRRPAREQLGLILAELGIGFAGRARDLDAVVRRAVPALRQTDRVLEILAQKRRTLQVLTRDADAVMGRLAANRRNVARFVREARDTATISAGRRAELRESIRRLPEFLRALRPTLGELETVAERQTPALRNLRASADDLELLLRRLGPFADAAQPAVEALGDASVAGRRAVGPARETVRKAGRLGELAKDPATNLRFSLEHIDDRDNAVERHHLSPGGRGFTGLEAMLRYPFTQSQAINLFDDRGYFLKLNILINECTGYTTAEAAKADMARTRRCNSWLGPNQPGITTPDPSPGDPGSEPDAGDPPSTSPAGDRRSGGGATAAGERGGSAPAAGSDRAPASSRAPRPSTPGLPAAPTVPKAPKAPPARPAREPVQGLLDYLLG